MNIRTPSLEAAAKVIVQFRTFESVEHLEVSAVSMGQDEAGFVFYTFMVNCLYEKPAAPARTAETTGGTDESEED
jgi:hypothetical protein